MRSAFSIPGISTTMRRVPCRWMDGSVTPYWLTRRRTMSMARPTAWSAWVRRYSATASLSERRSMPAVWLRK
ncbi:MAG: hypothetical protein BRD38_04365 [Bacteroidetes bacterium QH_9_67_14]|nr:MAG: hypothetical protein BRD38_04365 [Bacteroidetes bacterium QH_9_67_14]